MTYRAIYAYAWDIAELGAAAFADEVRGLGLDTVTLAGAYHAGKFLRPKGRGGKVYFPEDGTAYFRFDPKRYGRITPVANSLNAEHDLFRTLADTGLAVNAWMVLMHNTRLGTAYPDCTVENCFGDRYPYSLCPNNPDAQEYAVALCKDITANYPVTGRLARDARFSSLRPRLPPRIRIGEAEPLGRESPRPLLLHALH